MGLSLSTAAAPELDLEALDIACRDRGLDGVELAAVSASDLDALDARTSMASGARIVALRAEGLSPETAPRLARASGRLGVPLSVPSEALAPSDLSDLAAVFHREGGRLLLAQGCGLEAMAALVAEIQVARVGKPWSQGGDGPLGVAWELRPSSESLEDGSAVLFIARELLGLVRLHGGGPEQHDQDGLGVGGLLADLALSRYQGTIVLTPSRPETLPRWAKWLASRRSAGCGTIAESNRVDLDVRPVEPRDRLETILGTYRSLSRGATMELTVDHDPSCMYYTLEATEAEGSFTFRKVEDGPEVWRAEVTKL